MGLENQGVNFPHDMLDKVQPVKLHQNQPFRSYHYYRQTKLKTLNWFWWYIFGEDGNQFWKFDVIWWKSTWNFSAYFLGTFGHSGPCYPVGGLLVVKFSFHYTLHHYSSRYLSNFGFELSKCWKCMYFYVTLRTFRKKGFRFSLCVQSSWGFSEKSWSINANGVKRKRHRKSKLHLNLRDILFFLSKKTFSRETFCLPLRNTSRSFVFVWPEREF